jgi:dephospho-CoA kinase
MKKIIGFVGPMASGKGAASDYLRKKHDAGYHRFSTMIRDVMRRLDIEDSRENMQKLSLMLRQTFGQDLFAKAIKAEVESDPHDIVVIDGIRREGDVVYLRDLPNFILVYIDADIHTRYDRVVRRAENASDKDKTFEQFEKDHEADTEMTIPPLKNLAQVIIENNGTFEDFHQKIEALISK